jgi:hypothetical protein
MGWSQVDLKAALRLAAQAPWGTKVAEEIHASGSCVRKFHQGISSEMLRIRAFAHTVRRLLPTMSVEEKREHALAARLARLEARQPQKITARQVLLREWHQVSARLTREGRNVAARADQTVMRRHSSVFVELSHAARRRLELQAVVARADASERNASDIEALRLELVELRKQREKRSAEQGPLALSSCRWQADDLGKLQAAYLNPILFNAASIAARRAAVSEAPRILPSTALAQLEAIPVYSPDVDIERPPWLGEVARNREHFVGCSLEVEAAGGSELFAFMFATQSPVYVQCCRLVEVEAQPPSVDVTPETFDDVWLSSWGRRFECNFVEATPWHRLPRVAEEFIFVIRHLQYLGDNVVVSDREYLPLREFLSSLPAEDKPKGERPSASSGSKSHKAAPPNFASGLLQKHPWLAGVLENDVVEGDEGTAPPDSDVEHESGGGVALSDEAQEIVWKELHSARAALDAAIEEPPADFHVKLLGGKFTMERTGHPYDAVSAAPSRGSAAAEWIKLYFPTSSARFEVAAYGMDGARVLATCWCRKMQHYFGIFEVSGDAEYVYSGEDHDSWVEPADFTELFSILTGKHLKRCEWLRALRPKA